jgi:hypothetical protein
VPSAKVVELRHANLYIFLSNQAELVREIGMFLKDYIE